MDDKFSALIRGWKVRLLKRMYWPVSIERRRRQHLQQAEPAERITDEGAMVAIRVEDDDSGGRQESHGCPWSGGRKDSLLPALNKCPGFGTPGTCDED